MTLKDVTHDRKRGVRGQGLTAMELIIALVIVVILAAVSVPFILGALESYRLRAAAWQVAGDLRLTRQKAVSTLKKHRLSFNDSRAPADPNTYTIEKENGGWAKLTPAPLTFSKGVNIDPTSTPTTRKIEFDVKGRATQVGTIRLRSKAGGYDISVDTVGRVRVTKL